MPEYPTAHQVAVAIVAAARALDTDPIAVALGDGKMGGRHADHSASRARAYAAFALRQVVSCGPTSIGRMVGARNGVNFVQNFEWRLRTGNLPWWDNAVASTVLNALVRATEAPQPMRVQSSAPVRPAASERQISARRMLEEAMRNTANLPKPNP